MTTYKIETLTDYGWTDDVNMLGGFSQSDNSWPSQDAALAAIAELCRDWMWDRAGLRVVEVD